MITIINYSDKSIALVGKETIDIKDKLKELGGKYNSRLKCGAGWIFSNKQLSKIKFAFMNSRIPYKMEGEDDEETPSSPAPEIVFVDDDKDRDIKVLENTITGLESQVLFFQEDHKRISLELTTLQNKYEELLNKVNLLSISKRKPIKKKPAIIVEEDETEE